MMCVNYYDVSQRSCNIQAISRLKSRTQINLVALALYRGGHTLLRERERGTSLDAFVRRSELIAFDQISRSEFWPKFIRQK
jgi:hypothetical protein